MSDTWKRWENVREGGMKKRVKTFASEARLVLVESGSRFYLTNHYAQSGAAQSYKIKANASGTQKTALANSSNQQQQFLPRPGPGDWDPLKIDPGTRFLDTT